MPEHLGSDDEGGKRRSTDDAYTQHAPSTKRRRGRPRGCAQRTKTKKNQSPPELLPKGSHTEGYLVLNIEIDAEWFTREFHGKPPVALPQYL